MYVCIYSYICMYTRAATVIGRGAVSDSRAAGGRQVQVSRSREGPAPRLEPVVPPAGVGKYKY